MVFSHHKIGMPQSLGEILRTARKRKELSIEQMEEQTKVRARYLRALEQGRYEDLPETVYATGFLVKYAECLDLGKEKLIQLFHQERGLKKDRSKIMVERRLKEPRFQITPKFLMIAGICAGLLVIFGYIGFSVRNLTAPPNLEIASPSSDQIITTDKVEIVGKTDQNTTVDINNQPVQLDDKGNFKQEVKLTPGLNSFEIRAINGLKKENIKIIKVLAEFSEVIPELPALPGGDKKETDVTEERSTKDDI